MEYLTLRRVHSLEPKEVAKIIASFAYLCRHGKTPVSSSLVKTFEYVIMNKMHDYGIEELAQCLVALIRLQRASEKTKTIANQTLLEIFDKWSYELDDEDKTARVTTLAEVYYQVLSHPVLRGEVDMSVVEKKILETKDLVKPKDIFNLLHVTQSKEVVDFLVGKLEEMCDTLIPEEIVILNNLVRQHGIQLQLSAPL